MEFVIKYWIEVIFGGMVFLIGYGLKTLQKRVECEVTEQQAIKLGMQAILRDRLIQSYNHFMEKEYCAIHDKDNISNMYKQYHNLGANGVIDDLIDELNKLPVKKKGAA